MVNINGETGGTKASRGIFDGFDAYISPQLDDYKRLFNSGLVVLDTNVILNLYRYEEQTRNDFLAALHAIKNQIWIPHQVIFEFWQNRDAVMRDRGSSIEGILDAIRGAEESILAELNKWANRVSLDTQKAKALRNALASGLMGFSNNVSLLSNEKLSSVRDTHGDPVISAIKDLFQDRIGEPFDDIEHEEARKEALRRIASKEPPGFLDSKKSEDRAVGDYFIWREILTEASKRKVDVLLITGDSKADWWRIEGGEKKGPRPELYKELAKVSEGSGLYMLRPVSFLRHAQELLKVHVEPDSIRDVRTIKVKLLKSEIDENVTLATIINRYQNSDYMQYLAKTADIRLILNRSEKFDFTLEFPWGGFLYVKHIDLDMWKSREETLIEARDLKKTVDGYRDSDVHRMHQAVIVLPGPLHSDAIEILARLVIPVWQFGDVWQTVPAGANLGIGVLPTPLGMPVPDWRSRNEELDTSNFWNQEEFDSDL